MAIRQRDDDEITLDILALHKQGLLPVQIAKLLKITQRKVKRRLADVMHADCEHDPTAAEYWQQPPKGDRT